MKTPGIPLLIVLSLVVASAPVALAAQETVYQYDDGVFESGLFSLEYETQSAQRFRLSEGGEIQWLEACFWRRISDNEGSHRVTFNVRRRGRPAWSGTPRVGPGYDRPGRRQQIGHDREHLHPRGRHGAG